MNIPSYYSRLASSSAFFTSCLIKLNPEYPPSPQHKQQDNHEHNCTINHVSNVPFKSGHVSLHNKAKISTKLIIILTGYIKHEKSLTNISVFVKIIMFQPLFSANLTAIPLNSSNEYIA